MCLVQVGTARKFAKIYKKTRAWERFLDHYLFENVRP